MELETYGIGIENENWRTLLKVIQTSTCCNRNRSNEGDHRLDAECITNVTVLTVSPKIIKYIYFNNLHMVIVLHTAL